MVCALEQVIFLFSAPLENSSRRGKAMPFLFYSRRQPFGTAGVNSAIASGYGTHFHTAYFAVFNASPISFTPGTGRLPAERHDSLLLIYCAL